MIPANTRTQSLIDCGNGNWSFHRLLPDENSDWVMSNGAETHEHDIAYSDLDPNATSDHLYIRKATITILGPQTFNNGSVILVMEKESDSNFWIPILSCVDGAYRASDAWPDPGIKMTNDLQFCASIQYGNYSGILSWIFGSNEYRSAWLDLYFRIGG